MLISNFLRQHSGVEEVINAGWRIKWDDNEDETQIKGQSGGGKRRNLPPEIPLFTSQRTGKETRSDVEGASFGILVNAQECW